VNFQRGLRFNKTYQFTVSAKLTSFSITVISAFVLRNYWALVIGIMVENRSRHLSYAMEPHRPRFTLCKIRDIFSFSVWNLGKSIGGYLYRHLEKPMIGNFAGAPAMGRYSVAYDVTTLPSEELINPVVTALFPVMVKVNAIPVKRTENLSQRNFIGRLCFAFRPASVSALSGRHGRSRARRQMGRRQALVPWLALSFGLVAMSSNCMPPWTRPGEPARRRACNDYVSLEWRPSCCRWRIISKDLETIAMGRFWATLVMTPTLFVTLARNLEIPLRDILTTLAWPIISGLVWPPRWAARTV